MIPGRDEFVGVEGARLCVRFEGSGVPVIIPTGAGFAFYENTLSERFKGAVQRVYVEMRGTGGSTGQIAGATFGVLADDLEAVRVGLGMGPSVFLGHSNHGCIVTEHALRYPEGVRGTLSVGSCADFSRAFTFGQERWARESPPEQRAALDAALAAFEAAQPADPDAAMLERYITMAPLGWREPDFDHHAIWGQAPRGMAAYLGWLFGEGFQWDATERLRSLGAPLLAVCGRYDYLCPYELWPERQAAPNVEVAVLEGSAHNPQLEESERFDDLVLGFIGRVTR
jgi:L-proline amide hydrolase